MTNEPVFFGFSVTAIVAAVIGLPVAFEWWTPTAQQIASITTLSIVAVSIGAGLVVRARVTPTAKLAKVPLPPPKVIAAIAVALGLALGAVAIDQRPASASTARYLWSKGSGSTLWYGYASGGGLVQTVPNTQSTCPNCYAYLYVHYSPTGGAATVAYGGSTASLSVPSLLYANHEVKYKVSGVCKKQGFQVNSTGQIVSNWGPTTVTC